ncbi:hypothetical protein BU17DRAFT_65103 [Hysterangium stoloniferum]|nr:hypothetical protein BU17DRAFT_65103 [Hysterangium stoloniferum]
MSRLAGRHVSPPPSKTRVSNKGYRKEILSPSVISSHQQDTKDPFSALSLLRKLLDNSARSGYKMSSEENELSLHLLTVIEPFVGAAPMDKDEARRTMTRQPNEILDAIASHIDSRRDLLALALTCHRLRDVVLLRHLEYRVIHCKPSSEKVWRHLIAHPLLAANVRRILVMDERSRDLEVIPSRVAEEEDVHSEGLDMHIEHQRLIVNALAKMVNLASFAWTCNNSLVTFEDVSPTLFTCEMLKEVEITDNQMFSPSIASIHDDEGTRDHLIPSQVSEVPDLISVAIRTAKNTIRLSKLPSLVRIQDLLISHCPNLTTLRVGYDHRRPFIPRADQFLALGRWPSLRSLSLQNLWCSTHFGFEAAADFLAAHPLIETLHFELGRVQLELPVHTLPNLKDLVCSREVAVAILTCPMSKGQKRPLESLKGFKLGGGRDTALLQGIKGYPNLKRVDLLAYDDIEDVRKLAEVASKLTWLDVGKRSCTPAKASGPASVNEWAAVLSALPELTTFHGVHFFYEFSDASSHSDRSRIKKNDEVASMLAWKCPKLKRVDYWDNSGKVVILGKEGERLKWEVRRAKV